MGISEEHLAHVFSRFHRIEGSRARTHEGTGIGLALVQELVKLHGGTVRVESVVGKGSTFTVAIPRGTRHLPAERISTGRTLPSTALTASHYIEEAMRWLPDDMISPRPDSPPSPTPAATEARRRHAAGRAQRPRIVWADDNADMRDYVRRLLSGRYDVEAVADGEAALAAARRDAPDLVLADVMMPRLDGFGLLSALRADESTRTLPVILLSARAAEESRVDGLAAGADDYLVKPFSARELVARVGSQLDLASEWKGFEGMYSSSQSIGASAAAAAVAYDEPPLSGGSTSGLTKTSARHIAHNRTIARPPREASRRNCAGVPRPMPEMSDVTR